MIAKNASTSLCVADEYLSLEMIATRDTIGGRGE